ncbi:mechanosensitive ion channel family protein [Synoicihabitans lomoniglobus]|uniref:Mechanosensitive ion channel family protein n=1 Tax=Synoicihabitans lomoniglobus TaxID=2909285 RepID=A0AAE9ZUL0_9BACT|nr:mechanosensitive ion channel [Opitutaceae bacterium LMO-M01]WED64591.1 mechanosensitive ion channel family protein [Opitutaceae bacterium LMO-M01]
MKDFWRAPLRGVIFLVAITGSTLAQDRTTSPLEPTPVSPERIAVGDVADDEQIARRLTAILQSTSWFESVAVDVRDGVVFLDGLTDSPEHLAWAEQLAQRTEDVVAVVNRMTVLERAWWDFSPALAELRLLRAKIIRSLPLIVFSVFILFLSWWGTKAVARLARTSFEGRYGSALMVAIVARLVALPIFLIGLYIVLQVAGLTSLALTLLGGTGLMGVVIGFAFRDIAENLLASILLSLRRPFRPNDLIEVTGQIGIVQRMNTRCTVLMTMDGNHVQIPNATIFKNTIINYTANPNRRSDFVVGIGYDDSITAAQELIAQMLSEHPAVLNDPEPMVLVEVLGASTVNLRIYYWFDASRYGLAKLKSSLQRLTKRKLTDANISMPDEAREVVFPQGVPINMAPPPTGSTSAVSPSIPTPDPAPPAPPPDQENYAEEPVSMDAEGHLHSEAREVQEQAATAPTPEEGEDLLR